MLNAGSPDTVSFQIAPFSRRTTGRSLVLMRSQGEELAAGMAALREKAGISSVLATDLGSFATIRTAEIPQSTALVLDHIGVAVVNGDPDQIGRLSIQVTRSDAILAVEPERVVYAAVMPAKPSVMPSGIACTAPKALSPEYLRGYRDGFGHAIDLGFPESVPSAAPLAAPATAALDETSATYGLQITRVLESSFTGYDIRIAILDTGFAGGHPDFSDRHITAESLVLGSSPEDLHGHGTHCTGSAAGPRTPLVLPRYGIAYESSIYVGRVLDNSGLGTDGDILAGIDWAIARRCRVISMSLSAPVQPGDKPSTVFENTARRAAAEGALIIAAAGNDSDRREPTLRIAPVGHPANCPSIMAVAAVASDLQVAWFSNGGTGSGEINIGAPGVDVYSSWILPRRYNTISGTSMATPHVAGIAALHAQANPGITAVDLWTRLVKTARRLPLPARDVGSGLVQAPV